jgi:Fic family protein
MYVARGVFEGVRMSRYGHGAMSEVTVHDTLQMREFVADTGRADDSEPSVVRAAMAHLNLVMIHPFSDGNGRMGRAIQTFVLARDGVLEQPFSSIEEYLGSRGNTEAYYAILGEVGGGVWHPERDARPWVRFCLKAHLQQATTLERRVRETARLWSDLEAEIQRKKLPDRAIYALYDAAMGFRVKSERYRSHAEISNQVASLDLRTLVDNGLLTPHGEKRGRTYVASPHLVAMRDASREARPQVEDVFIRQLNLPI